MSTRIQFLQDQFQQSRHVIQTFLDQVPSDKWFEKAGMPQSNIAWQVGHLVIATNLQGISMISGPDESILKQLSLPIYRKYCIGLGSKERVLPEDLMEPSQLVRELNLVHTICQQKLAALSDEELDLPAEATSLSHPIAKTKYEILSWLFKHDAWHCAEMELIKLNLGLGFKWQ